MQIAEIDIQGTVSERMTTGKESSQRLEELLGLIKEFNHPEELDTLIIKIMDAATSLMGAQSTSIILFDELNRGYNVCYRSNPVENKITARRLPSDKIFCEWVINNKQPLFTNEVEIGINNGILGANPSKFLPLKNLICAPLLDKEHEVIGLLEVNNCFNSREVEPEDVPLFQAFANHAASAIVRMQNYFKRDKGSREAKMHITEIHHRVKNDLALISGIVEVESLEIDSEDAKNVLTNIQCRIKSMAAVYDLLSGNGSHTKADVGVYFKKLVNGISDSLTIKNTSIKIDVDAERVVLDPYKTLSCGLIINELMLNSFKHAFHNVDQGHIQIKLSKQQQNIKIIYKDNGPGLPNNFDPKEQDSIGFEMIFALIEQLDGSFEVKEDDGAHFAIRFKTEGTDNITPFKKSNGLAHA